MAFEYNGFVYRDLEPQVRYDAEQVQLLKQADVTINENLQTVNTELNSKITKPATPTAESAVTMLADGTTSTKPLSEIGGGKVYMHRFNLIHGSEPTQLRLSIYFYAYDRINRTITEFVNKLIEYPCAGEYQQYNFNKGVCFVSIYPDSITVSGIETFSAGQIPTTGEYILVDDQISNFSIGNYVVEEL